jgi:hypothetical protein
VAKTHRHLLGSTNGTWSNCKLHGSSCPTAKFYWLKKQNIPEPSRTKEVDEVSWAGY